MADVPVRAQLRPAAGVVSELYAAKGKTIVSTITACVVNGSKDSFSLSFGLAGEADDDKQYVYEDVPIRSGVPFMLTFGPTLLEDDIVRVKSDGGTVSFSLFALQVD